MARGEASEILGEDLVPPPLAARRLAMLKSLAIQTLARWTGRAHLQEMQRAQLTTQSSSLASLVSDVIQKALAETAEEARRRQSQL